MNDNVREGRVVIGGYIVGMIQTNVYYLHREGNPETILVDPADQGDALVDALEGMGLSIAAILLTHAHFDHIGGVTDVKKRTGASVYICEKETRLIHDTEANLSAMYHRPTTVEPDVFLRDGEYRTIADITFRCIWTPGHTEGSCCYYIEDTGAESADQASVDSSTVQTGAKCPPILISGDTLFEESVGRTDFPTGSMSSLVRSVREKLLILPDNTLVYPGHGGMTTIGHEKQFNPCV